jgi:EAL domain-containing protein (putative c-di-GMP-specific phosphodiesterase class I)
MQDRVDQRTDLETRLRGAFDLGQLSIMYQPQVDRTGRLYGAEALMRWHPDNGEPIPPSLFIPVAEESGLIDSIGQWALEVTCQQIRRWLPMLPVGFRVAVNVSATEFMNAGFPARVVEILERTGVSGRHLRLEITEANVMTELRVAAERMSALRAHDVEFSLDDFGTGYSSLTYLRQLPVTEVKIDRSYVRRFLVNAQDEAILRAILALCASLDIRVVAEGVETMEQWHRLMDDGCPYFQGYLFGRAMPPSADPGDLLAESLTRAH